MTIVSRRERASRGAIGVDRGQRTVVTGIHRLEHVERFAAAALTDDDAIGPHTQRVADQVADADFAGALNVRRARFEPDDVVLVERKLGRVFDGDDAVGVGDVAREDVEEGRLTGTGTAGDDDVEPRFDRGAQEVEDLGRGGAEAGSGRRPHAMRAEPADRQRRAVERRAAR